MKLWGIKDIKHFMKDYILQNRDYLSGKLIVDIPAGSGFTSKLLKEVGAVVEAYDLFPEFFTFRGVVCRKADISEELPIRSGYADIVLFQEGIEHLSDQLHALKEVNRILKPGGSLIITTPNYSSMRSKISNLLNESEFYKLMPPNQIESIWFSEKNGDGKRVYYGHIYLIGLHKLRLLALLSGLKIRKIHHTRVNKTSLLLLLLFYPLMLLSSYSAYRRSIRKNNQIPLQIRERILKESLKLQIDPRILVDGHLFVEFEKFCELDDVVDEIDLFHKYEKAGFQT